MPDEFTVHKSKRLTLLFGAVCAAICCVMLYGIIDEWMGGRYPKQLPGRLLVIVLFTLGPLFSYRKVMQQPLALVVFRRGLFWPTLQREVIPWIHVESVRIADFGRGRRVAVVFSRQFEASLAASSRLRSLMMKIDALIGWRGRILSESMLDHSVDEIVHVIDDWIRYERGLPIKQPIARGPFAAVADWIRGRNVSGRL